MPALMKQPRIARLLTLRALLLGLGLCAHGHATTQPPSVLSPPSFTTLIAGGNVTYLLPEAPLAGSVELIFTNIATDAVIVIPIEDPVVASVGEFTLTQQNRPPDGLYSLSLKYQDLAGNPPAEVTVFDLTIDSGTVPASFLNLAGGSILTNGNTIAYVLPEVPQPGRVQLIFGNGTSDTVIALGNAQSSNFTYTTAAHGATIPPGIYDVSLKYRDLAGNLSVQTTASGVAVLSAANDTDGDGLNDVAEARLTALGFNWQVAQPTLTAAFLADTALFTQAQVSSSRLAGQADVTAAPDEFNLYTLDGLQDLFVDTPLLVRDPVTGKWTLTVALQRSTDLNSFVPFPFSAESTTINPAGELEFDFTDTDKKIFFRLQAR